MNKARSLDRTSPIVQHRMRRLRMDVRRHLRHWSHTVEATRITEDEFNRQFPLTPNEAFNNGNRI